MNNIMTYSNVTAGFFALALAISPVALTGCEEAEDAGEHIEDAAEETVDGAQDAVDEAQDAADEVQDEMRQSDVDM